MLPPEITDRIIVLCSDDRMALLRLAIVCREWLPASRTAFFAKPIDIFRPSWHGPLEVDRDLSTVICDDAVVPLLQSPLSTLPRYLKSLQVRYYNRALHDLPRIHAFCETFLARGIQLDHFRLDWTIPEVVTPPVANLIIASYSSVRHLSFYDVYPNILPAVLQHVPRCTTLTSLSIRAGPWVDVISPNLATWSAFLAPSSISTIELGTNLFPVVLPWLVGSDLNLRKIRVRVMKDSEELEVLWPLLTGYPVITRCLEELDVFVAARDSVINVVHLTLPVSSFKALKTLRIRLGFETPLREAVYQLLPETSRWQNDHAQTPALHNFVLRLDQHRVEEEECSALDKRLASYPFKDDAVVTFIFSTRRKNVTRERISSYFPLCLQQKRFRFEIETVVHVNDPW